MLLFIAYSYAPSVASISNGRAAQTSVACGHRRPAHVEEGKVERYTRRDSAAIDAASRACGRNDSRSDTGTMRYDLLPKRFDALIA